ncbi:MAG: ribulose-phosphate 3-epimerase [Epulopiscium sp.]|nr:ribulose-phosphate 3-epimerase [Candidatus Epulonipiscium sp.]
MNISLSPSLLSADFAKVGEQLTILENAGTPYLHLDVMDGVFVPNISFGIPVIKSIRKASNMIFDVHLMIVNPEKYVDEFRAAGADIINFHVEATDDPSGVIQKIKSSGAKAAITLKPKTPVSAIEPYLADIDMVLVMTVEPGFGGQKFMEDQMDKIKTLAHIREEKKLAFDIEVDGGIGLDNVSAVIQAGANVIVAGSAVFGAEDMAKRVKDFIKIFEEHQQK